MCCSAVKCQDVKSVAVATVAVAMDQAHRRRPSESALSTEHVDRHSDVLLVHRPPASLCFYVSAV